MFGGKSPTELEKQIDKAVRSLNHWEIQSEEYASILSTVAKLQEIKEKENPDRISKDTAAVIAANLMGIILIIKHEQVNVISTRALNLVMKLRS
jgi:hypothetical protein